MEFAVFLFSEEEREKGERSVCVAKSHMCVLHDRREKISSVTSTRLLWPHKKFVDNVNNPIVYLPPFCFV